TVLLKGASQLVATTDHPWVGVAVPGPAWTAQAGSGDVLGGIVAGLLARGASPLRAAAWGVFLHGEAGNALALRHGIVGLLARELSAEVPRILHRTQSARASSP
ncbi:MAG TPA: NAD(P)H-hydrate dehydratase, partial [Longimicrobium sp.]|nr:NAD(P)H-hydrate dehydratase [Longimicrobium sp.]